MYICYQSLPYIYSKTSIVIWSLIDDEMFCILIDYQDTNTYDDGIYVCTNCRLCSLVMIMILIVANCYTHKD